MKLANIKYITQLEVETNKKKVHQTVYKRPLPKKIIKYYF